jgi:GTP-binding protein HflX
MIWFIIYDVRFMLRPVTLAQLVPPSTTHEQAMDLMLELESLVQTYGWLVVDKSYQKKSHPDYHTYIGSGKLEEIHQQMLTQWIDLLIIGNQLKPSQVFHIIRMMEADKIEVWDRIDLILNIFEKHAVSAEAKLQIELAAVKHMWPRIFGMGMELSRQWWGTGWSGGRAGRWIGETNTERMRRHLKDKELEIRRKLDEYSKMRWLHRANRKRKWLQTVGIVWYTNAGKSTLFNALWPKQVLSENKLFATLGTHVGKMWIAPTDKSDKVWEIGSIEQKNNRLNEATIEQNNNFSDFSESFSDFSGREVLINDTIGFIQDLPPELINAFTSTLEDSVESDLLLHTIAADDPKILMKIWVVNDILDQIWASQPRLLVFNKIDRCDPDTLTQLRTDYPDAVFVSAITGNGIEELKQKIMTMI